uniref:Carbamoyl phosphate synthase small chain n=1 Tax=Chondria sp. (in: red algae) TaxID=1982705 RepID=A0A1Z1MDM6_9FLOR|nr:carbamoyl phosphate synthase small subunit [Chondria sp. (in: red algae)]
MSNNLYPAILYLEDGTLYRGWSFLQLSSHFGEVVFNTGMVGYQEIFTDPSYSGQMVVFTYPELGNTGLNSQDSESSIVHIKALIARNISNVASNWRSLVSLRDFLISKRLPHIFGIDTRSLTKHLRFYGVMSALISNSSICLDHIYFKKRIDFMNLVAKVTTVNKYYVRSSISHQLLSPYSNRSLKNKISIIPTDSLKIIIVDFGFKLNLVRKLLSLGCETIIVPAECDYQTILRYDPDGILLSNGPGNPLVAKIPINTVKNLIYFSNIPILGICMGHQLLNLALGAEIFKLTFGHRGLNHPSGCSNYSEITSQNHGFAVDQQSMLKSQVSKSIYSRFYNLNDFTVASTLHKSHPIFSVQYHPEASPGPRDSDYIFSTFVELIRYMKLKS